MGLVDYDSDSGSSDGETLVAVSKSASTTATPATGKKPIQKLVDRANPGKILVNLPTGAVSDIKADRDNGTDDDDSRPAKRAKVGEGVNRFRGFGSFLPPPKKTTTSSAGTTAAEPSSGSSSYVPKSTPPSRPGVNLKTSSEAAFSRRDGAVGGLGHSGSADDAVADQEAPSRSSKLSLPPPKIPSIPQGQKAPDDVKLVGNPLMFMPLSVSRKPGKKRIGGGGEPNVAEAAISRKRRVAADTDALTAPAPAKKMVSLFSLGAQDQAEVEQDTEGRETEDWVESEGHGENSDYQPLVQEDYASTYASASGYGYEQQQQQQQQRTQAQYTEAPASLDTFANDLQLSAKERRELFGRKGAGSGQISATFNMDQEYRHNEALRQAGELEQQQSHNPVRALMPGKHSLRQLVNAVHTQKDALEENFAKNRASQRESGGRYGWR